MIDITKKYKTRGGGEARVYATDTGGYWPVHGEIQNADGSWRFRSWTVNGFAFEEKKERIDDLIEVKPNAELYDFEEKMVKVKQINSGGPFRGISLYGKDDSLMSFYFSSNGNLLIKISNINSSISVEFTKENRKIISNFIVNGEEG